MKDKYLRVDARKDGSFVTINGNAEGLLYLRECINSLLKTNSTNLPSDVMLMTEEMGGEGLTIDKPFRDESLVQILKIYRWE